MEKSRVTVNENRRLERKLSLDVYLALYLKPAAGLNYRTMRARELHGNWISRRRNDKSNFRDIICTRERQNGRGTLIRSSVVSCPPQQAGRPGVNYVQLSTRSVASAKWSQWSRPTKRPYYMYSMAYNEICCYTATIIITLVLTRHDYGMATRI